MQKRTTNMFREKRKEEELVAISDYNRIQFELNHSIRPKYTIPVGIRPINYSGEIIRKDNDILGGIRFS